jgi:putative transcriptional regulator
MRDDLFQELLDSVSETAAVIRGEAPASGNSGSIPEVDVAAVRHGLDLSQARFAALLGISMHTLRNWEQGRRRPEGPAQALLRIAERRPQVIVEVMQELMAELEPVPDTPRSSSRKARAA